MSIPGYDQPQFPLLRLRNPPTTGTRLTQRLFLEIVYPITLERLPHVDFLEYRLHFQLLALDWKSTAASPMSDAGLRADERCSRTTVSIIRGSMTRVCTSRNLGVVVSGSAPSVTLPTSLSARSLYATVIGSKNGIHTCQCFKPWCTSSCGAFAIQSNPSPVPPHGDVPQ